MLLNLLVASLVPFFIWIIQEIMGKTGPKATYLRKRIFAYGILLALIFNVIGIINIYQEVGDSPAFSRVIVRNIFYWVLLFKVGLMNKPNEYKGFFYSIWQPYKAEYISDKNKVSKSQKKILKNKEPEFLSDKTKEGWLIDQENIWCKRFYLKNNPNADLKQYVVLQNGKILPNQDPEITKELELSIKEAKSDWNYYLKDGWLPTSKKWN